MGWANDMYAYLETDPLYRMYQHDKLTFSMMYAFDENYILPVSHDEVVHGKKSLIDKCYGEYEQKFATDRTFFAYMMAHPGKKMTFMGCEYGQFREWDYESSLEWFMLDYPRHAQLRLFVGDLNRLYLRESCLWEDDFTWGGFRWIYPDRREDNVSAFARRNLRGEEIVTIFHFSPVCRQNYEISTLSPGEYDILLNTDEARYGGADTPLCCTQTVGSDGILRLTLPPLSALYFKKKIH
jgi:1,4-alpha-glucan branching enzyme